jgi:hypothetical protein
MDQAEFDKLLPQQQPQEAQPQQAAPQGEDQSVLGSIGDFFDRLGTEISTADQRHATDPNLQPKPSQGLGQAVQQAAGAVAQSAGQDALETGATVTAGATGAMRGVFEMSDFFWGENPTREKMDPVRGAITDLNDQAIKDAGTVKGTLASGLGEFTLGMLAAGGLGEAAKALPWVGKAVGAVPRIVAQAGEAAAANAIAFDPHDANVSDMFQGTPLANPVTSFLQSDPNDSEAWARTKRAMESLGLDTVIVGTLGTSLKIYKMLQHGDTAGAQAEAAAFKAKQRRELSAENTVDPSQAGGSPTEVPQPDGVTGGNAPEATPTGNGVDVPSDGAPGPTGAPGDAIPAGNQGELPPAQQSGEPVAGQGLPGDNAAPGAATDVLPGGPSEAVGKYREVGGPVDPTKGTAAYKPIIDFSTEDTAAVLKKASEDAKAMYEGDGYYGAVINGHNFGNSDHIPYGKFRSDQDFENFMTRVMQQAGDRIEAYSGGVQGDDATKALATKYKLAFGRDASAGLAALQQEGRDLNLMSAKMNAVMDMYSSAQMDVYRTASKMKAEGSLTDPLIIESLRQKMSIAASLGGVMDNFSSNAGRMLRMMRRDVLPFDNIKGKDFARLLKNSDPSALVDMILDTKGNPGGMTQLLRNPTWVEKAQDIATYMRVNNLISSPVTIMSNTIGNTVLGILRPAERLIGSPLDAGVQAIRGRAASLGVAKEAALQYSYAATGIMDSLKTSIRAMLRGDSILSPHFSQANPDRMGGRLQTDIPGAQPIGAGYFRPFDSIGNIIYNTVSVPMTLLGTPTRLLNGADELAKQITYRSKVAAEAHVKASLEAMADGSLNAAGKKAYIKGKVNDALSTAFDAEGRATNSGAETEAKIATLQQDLLPGSWGKSIMNFRNNHWTAKFFIPFVKTPTNALRYGVKYTPVLNLLQKEYRGMLASPDATIRAQAMGQMALGTAFLGTAASLVLAGKFTGGGPTDPKQRAQMIAEGWKPYAFVHERDDGKRDFYSLQRLDPVASVFGMVADVVDAMHAIEYDGNEETMGAQLMSAFGSIGLATVKQLQQKSYLQGIAQVLDAVESAGTEGKQAALNNWLKSQAQSMVPLSGFTRYENGFSGDEHLRDARSMVDALMQVTPGFSDELPYKRNWMGEPMVAHPGMMSTAENSLVDREMERLQLQNGSTFSAMPKQQLGVDLTTVKMSDGKNAYDRYQELIWQAPGMKNMRQQMAHFMKSEAYRNAPDGPADVHGTKLNLLAGRREVASKRALGLMRRDPEFRKAIMKQTQRDLTQFPKVRAKHPEWPAPKKGVEALKSMVDGMAGELTDSPAAAAPQDTQE